MDESTYVLGFSACRGIGTKRFMYLLEHFGTSEKAWCAPSSKIITVLGKKIGETFCEFRKTFNLSLYSCHLKKQKIAWFTPFDKRYPKLLKQLLHPPFILFAKGNISLLQNKKTIGVVGTRKVSSYGRQVTKLFTRELVKQGFIIVSGMALGVDGIAHEEALLSSGYTIAVLGSGVDRPTPREHAHLYHKILTHDGLIISTFSPGEDAHKGSFPARNAIIAGLSQGILVTEGARDSGSLITAQHAKQFGRPIFAVPGQITSYLSEGTNSLIRQGATVTSSIHDIIRHFQQISSHEDPQEHFRLCENKREIKARSPNEKYILDLLEKEPLLFDEIVRKMGKDSKSVGSLLSMMELQGLIQCNPEGKYFLQ